MKIIKIGRINVDEYTMFSMWMIMILPIIGLAYTMNTVPEIMHQLTYNASYRGCSTECLIRNGQPDKRINSLMIVCFFSGKCEGCYYNQLYDISCESVYRLPAINCIQPSSPIFTPEGQTEAVVTWQKPLIDEGGPRLASSGHSVQTVAGSGTSGQPFSIGNHSFSYSITNRFGFTAMCDVQFEVRAHVCLNTAWPTNGRRRCESDIPYWGSTCIFECDSGYRLTGEDTTTCQLNGQFDTPPPICEYAFPPSITCYPPPNQIIADAGSTTAVITWTQPLARDQSGIKLDGVQQITGKYSSGQAFPKGQYFIQYKVIDGNGAGANCSFEFEVTVDHCDTLQAPANGIINCSHPDFIRGSTCSFQCKQGFILTGTAIITCLDTNSYDYGFPICEAITCPAPLSANGYISCNNGREMNSQCSVWCKPGYSLIGSFATSTCLNGIWQNGIPQCSDTETPVFDNCPSEDVIVWTSDDAASSAVASWNLTTKDNSGLATLSLESPLGSGDSFSLGTTNVSYKATDAANQTSVCSFNVIVQHLRCNEPIFTDTTVQFACAGYKRGDQCNITCLTGKELLGASTLTCTGTSSNPIVPFWDRGGANEPLCKDILCENPVPPSNGTVTCSSDNFSKSCQLSCNGELDYPRDADSVYSCAFNTGVWQPSNRVPDCIEKKLAPQMYLEAELYLSNGACAEAAQVDQLKSKFFTDVHNNGLWIQSCQQGKNCTIEKMEVSCMPAKRRKKRETNHDDTHQIVKRQTDHDASIKWQFRIDFNTDGRTVEDARYFHESILFELALAMDDDVNAGTFDDAIAPFQTLFYEYGVVANFACGAGELANFDTGTCRICASGTKYNNVTEECEICPINFYQPSPGSDHCIACDYGKFNVDVGSKSQSQCNYPCQIGYYSTSGYEPCTKCPTGSSNSPPSSKNCTRPVQPTPPPLIDYCSPTPCGTDNTCQTKPNGYSCFCTTGYRGNNCEIDIDPCTTHMCKNGGTCQNNSATNTYICICTDFFDGQYCDQPKASSVSEWGLWQSWDPCSANDCGEGVETRSRVCSLDTNQTPCVGSSEDSRLCNLENCPVCVASDLFLPSGVTAGCSGSTDSMTCITSCGTGLNSTYSCSGGIWSPSGIVTPCNRVAGWSEWSKWSACDVLCGGSQKRTRVCNNPPPNPTNQPCSGVDEETKSCIADPSAGCSGCNAADLKSAPGVKVSCTGSDISLTCSLSCPSGLVFLEVPPIYNCYFGTWTPGTVLIPCTDVVPPKAIERTFTATYQSECSNQAEITALEQQLRVKIETLHCALTSMCTRIITISCGGNPVRKKRAIQETTAKIELSTSQVFGSLDLQGYISNAKESESLTKIVESLDSLDKSTQQIKTDATFYEVTISGVKVSPSSSADTGVIVCPGQSVSQGGLCVSCAPGTYFSNGTCILCEEGSYQESSAQSSCTPCPSDGTTVYTGSYSVNDCSDVTTAPSTGNGDDTVAIIFPIVILILIVIVTLIILYIYKKKKGNRKNEIINLSSNDELSRTTPLVTNGRKISNVAPLATSINRSIKRPSIVKVAPSTSQV